MRFARVMLLCAAVVAMIALVRTVQLKLGRPREEVVTRHPSEPVVVVDSFTRDSSDGSNYLRICARLENHTNAPIVHMSTFGRPVLWAYHSNDGVRWEGPAVVAPGCGVGYYAAPVLPGESSPKHKPSVCLTPFGS